MEPRDHEYRRQNAPSEKPRSCLARQPILSKVEKVLGYELLLRESAQEDRFNADLEEGTRSIIDTLNVMGLDAVCDGRRAFINCSHDMLLKGFFQLLPAEKAVVEIQENVSVDERVVAACKQLRMESYEIALDHVTPGDAREKLIPFANYLKIDVRGSSNSRALPSSRSRGRTAS
jgi:EAL and modified HD-GYP domain-containing signal transduction protein